MELKSDINVYLSDCLGVEVISDVLRGLMLNACGIHGVIGTDVVMLSSTNANDRMYLDISKVANLCGNNIMNRNCVLITRRQSDKPVGETVLVSPVCLKGSYNTTIKHNLISHEYGVFVYGVKTMSSLFELIHDIYEELCSEQAPMKEQAPVQARKQEQKAQCNQQSMSIGDAVRYLKLGKRVSRKSWDKGTYLQYLSGGLPVSSDSISINPDYNNSVLVHLANGKVYNWVANANDLLAEDYIIVG